MSESFDDRKSKRKALGKGLGALIPPKAEPRDYFLCALERIEIAPHQPRKEFNSEQLRELSESIRQSGLIQPLVVRSADNGRYQLIAGERRWRACKMAGIREVPVVVKEATDAEAFALALVENIQRADLNPIEEAMAYQRLLEEHDYTQATLAQKVGKSRPTVANALRLLNLPTHIQERVASGELTAGHARTLIALAPEDAEKLAERFVEEKMSVREAETAVKGVREEDHGEAPDVGSHPENPEAHLVGQAPEPRYRDDVLTRDVVSKLRQSLATKVILKDRNGAGRIEIHYDNYDVLQSILERIVGDSF